MNGGFVKLYGSIVTSSIWVESHETVRVWITMLALADRNGFVQGTAPGLASIARMTLVECEESLAKLAAPDRHSRTSDHEGRRIEAVDGGWVLLNHGKYRQIRTQEQVSGAERVKRHRAKKAQGRNTGVTDVTSNDVTHQRAEGRDQKQSTTTASTDAFDQFWSLYPRRAGGNPRQDAERCWNVRLREGHAAEAILDGLRRYVAYVESAGSVGTEFVMQAKRFLGPSLRFQEDWSVSTKQNGKLNPGLQQMANILGREHD